MHPLPLVVLIIGLFSFSALTLAGLIWSDWRAERRLNRAQRDHLKLSLDSLIQELTAGA